MSNVASVQKPVLRFQREGEYLVATILEERLRDIGVVNQLREEFLAEVNSNPTKLVVLNLRHVTFVGSVAFMAFLAMRRGPGVERVMLCEVDPNVKSVFEICKLIPTGDRPTAPFELTDTLNQATSDLFFGGTNSFFAAAEEVSSSKEA